MTLVPAQHRERWGGAGIGPVSIPALHHEGYRLACIQPIRLSKNLTTAIKFD